MILEAKCKICGKGLHLEIDDTYAAMGDPHGLIKLAACNNCADFREEELRIYRASRVFAIRLVNRVLSTPPERDYAKEQFEKFVKRYMRILADRFGIDLPNYDPQIVDWIMEKPENYNGYLRQVKTMFRQSEMGL